MNFLLDYCRMREIEIFKFILGITWHRGVVVITTAQLHSTKPELRLCADLIPARGVSEFRDGEDL